MYIKSWSVMHNFVYPLEFKIDFSKLDFESLKKHNGVLSVLYEYEKHYERNSIKADKNSVLDENYVPSKNYASFDPKVYNDAYSKLFSKYYLDLRRSIRIFLGGLRIKSIMGFYVPVLVNCLIDRRGYIIITFQIDYEYEDQEDYNIIIDELYNPHINSDTFSGGPIININGNFHQVAKKYLEYLKEFFESEVRINKPKNLIISDKEMDHFYEPYAITIIKKYESDKWEEINDLSHKNDMLKILFWDNKILEEIRPENVEELYRNVSRATHEIVFFSSESTIIVGINKKKSLQEEDILYVFFNVELLLIQKLVLQIYDLVMDRILSELRKRTYRYSTITEIRNYLSRDIEEFFDIRIKKYQRGREITEAGRKVLNLDQYYNELKEKLNTLDGLINAAKSQYMEALTVLVTVLSVIVLGIISAYEILPSSDKQFALIVMFISLVGAFIFFIFKKS